MSKIAPEIEALMWTLAESGDAAAQKQFIDRYPQLASELRARIVSVNALKAKGIHRLHKSTPSWKRPQPEPIKPGAIALASAAVVLAAATIAVITVNARQESRLVATQQATAPLSPSNAQDIGPYSSIPREQLDPNNTVLLGNGNSPQVQGNGHASGTSSGGGALLPAPSNPPDDPMAKRQDLRIKGAPLHQVLDLVANAGRFKIEIAPGTPNPTIVVDFVDMTPREMLIDLARDYAFTALDEGDRTYLVIPAVDDQQGLPATNTPAEFDASNK